MASNSITSRLPRSKPSNVIWIADKAFPIDWPTYTHKDTDPGYNAYIKGCTWHSENGCGPGGAPYDAAKGLSGRLERYRPRRISERSLAAAQAVIKQFVIHMDGCLDARMCWNVLHNERGLSCHFILDNDGTLYQTMDLIDCAYHAAGLNETSIGIEICNRGTAKDPAYYSKHGLKRDIVKVNIHNEQLICFDYAPVQIKAMEELGRVLAKALPGIKLDYPQKGPGDPLWTVIDPADKTSARLRQSYAGYIGHYHITYEKWDPGSFDFKRFIGKLRGRRQFPIGLHDFAKKTEIPADPAEVEKLVAAYYDNNESALGGFFPVGPLEGHRLWHNGIHLHAPDKGDRVVAPLQGKVIAARNGPPVPGIGSRNFVLLKHSMAAGDANLEFFSLFMHLAEMDKSTLKKAKAEIPKWLNSEFDQTEPGRTVVYEHPEPVQANDLLGLVGEAGPYNDAQIHFEIFALSHGPVDKIDQEQFWHMVYGAQDRRFCKQKTVLDRIEKGRKDGMLSEAELFDFFHDDPDREWMRQVVSFHVSEWTVDPDWKQELKEAGEFKKFANKPRELEELVDEQITPLLWWTPEVAQKLSLPLDGMIYTYHPITFLAWLNRKLGDTKDSGGVSKATDSDIVSAANSKSKLKMDLDDEEGTSFVTEDEMAAVSVTEQLELKDLLDGYGD
jgi:hypothetical protein